MAATKISSVVDFPLEGLDLNPYVPKPKGPPPTPESPLGNGLYQSNGCFSLGNWKHRASFKKHIVSSTSHKTATLNGEQEQNGMIYDLYAVCNHHGKDMLGGHYTGKVASVNSHIGWLN